VPSFTDAALFNLGLAENAAGLSASEPLIGGGIYNDINSLARELQGEGPLDTSGPFDNTPVNANSIDAGYRFGEDGSLDPDPFPTGGGVCDGDYAGANVESGVWGS